MALFTVENLTFTYPAGKKAALKDINLTVNAGEFTVICGRSGSGKSTLLRQLKTELAPFGERSGNVLFCGRPLEEAAQREQAAKIGFVMQNPDNQIVTDKVWHELAFGLESLGYDTDTIRLRVAETASFFGIQEWFDADVSRLSGGQKQLLNLAAVMAMQPEVLLLDEPTSRLDPIAAGKFLETVKRINRELGTTVIISEHRLEEIFAPADKVIVMDEGRIIARGVPAEAAEKLAESGDMMFHSMPVPVQIYAKLAADGIGQDLSCPVDVRSGRLWLTQIFEGKTPKITTLPSSGSRCGKSAERTEPCAEKPAIKLKDIWFRYEKNGRDIIKDCSLEICGGELFAIVGGNGAGKTTLLNIIAGLKKPYRGTVRIGSADGKDGRRAMPRVALLPQDPQNVFIENTVRKDLLRTIKEIKKTDTGNEQGLFKNEKAEESEDGLIEIAKLTETENLLGSHPYDLSGGEQQRAALAKLLLTEPDIILLDEPTKGIDNYFKKQLAEILRKLCRQGKTVIIVSHDTEFCAQYADRCAMIFDGRIMAAAAPREFFSGNSFYTTAASRMTRHMFTNAVTAGDAAELIRSNFRGGSGADGEEGFCGKIHDKEESGGDEGQGGSKRAENIRGSFTKNEMRRAMPKQLKTFITFCTVTLAIAAAFAGIFLMNDRKYYIVSFAVAVLAAVSFFLSFERRRPKTGEIMIIAVLTAIAAAGRAVFFMTPNFKPVAAVTVIAGVCLGPQAGFLVGAMSGFVSDFFFGQGPWTPWQMCGFGMTGFIAGLIGKCGKLGQSRVALAISGAILTFFVYGGIVDLWTVFGFYSEPSVKAAAVVYTAALPFNIIHASSSAIFLYFLANPMREKLERIKLKYGFGFAR